MIACVCVCLYVRRVEMETYMHTYGPASMHAWGGKRSAAKKGMNKRSAEKKSRKEVQKKRSAEFYYHM